MADSRPKLATQIKLRGRRPGIDKERAIEIACKRESLAAIEYLFSVLKDDTVETRWRIVAAKEVLDRGFGRPRQNVEQKVTIEGGDALLAAIAAGNQRIKEVGQIIDHNSQEVITYEPPHLQ